jgi:hypothetical protein
MLSGIAGAVKHCLSLFVGNSSPAQGDYWEGAGKLVEHLPEKV